MKRDLGAYNPGHDGVVPIGLNLYALATDCRGITGKHDPLIAGGNLDASREHLPVFVADEHPLQVGKQGALGQFVVVGPAGHALAKDAVNPSRPALVERHPNASAGADDFDLLLVPTLNHRSLA